MSKTTLPARPPFEGEFGPAPASITDVKVGDRVVIFSRGGERVAQVEKVGRTNLTCIYTTKGAWDTAQRIHEDHLSIAPRMGEFEERTRKQAARNFDFYVRESNPETAEFGNESFDNPERVAKERAAYAKVASVGKEAYIENEWAKERERLTKFYEKAVEDGIEQYVHVTTKNVKFKDVIGHKESA